MIREKVLNIHKTGKPRKSPLKQPPNTLYSFLSDGISFQSRQAPSFRGIYFPLCGITSDSIKSSITPYLGGDIKVDKNRYLTKPSSVEDLRTGLRNFFCAVQGKGVVSLANGKNQDACVEAGMLWHKLSRTHHETGLELEALNFVPVTGENIECMRVTVKNISG